MNPSGSCRGRAFVSHIILLLSTIVYCHIPGRHSVVYVNFSGCSWVIVNIAILGTEHHDVPKSSASISLSLWKDAIKQVGA
jgi:hypothetical protein